jgi:NAD(P)-dependent dehydrogenase (short-subunit alcohol dehydrogenase family)
MASDTSFDPIAQFRLDGKIAIVTGASSGLGARFARVLHAAGATVVVTARRLDRLESLSKDLPAGITHKIAIESETLDMFEETMEVNTTAIWHLCKLAGENMVANRSGTIVNVASILGMIAGTPIKQANYAASKGAVIALSREIAVQWARKGVRVNSLCPGWFVSEMTAGMDTDDSSQKYVMQNSPIPRMGAEHELDGALLFMASDASSFMTGQTVVVDGGWTAR